MTSAPAYDHLWQPLAIGPMQVKHRVMVTGHALLYGRDGTLSDRHVAYYRERARGGAALLVTEQQAAHPSGVNYHAGCKAYDPRSVAWYAKAADAVHAHGAKLLAQLFCGGAQGSGTMYIDEWRPLLAPSRVASTQFHELPKEMTGEDIASVVAGFATSARHVEAGGLDGVEIHAAHSQLLGAFLSPALNRRTDGYGGSLENRCRIVLEIGEAVREATGKGFAAGLRLGVSEYLPGGIDEEESLRQIELLARSGLFDFYDLSAGGYFAKHVSVTPMTSDLANGFLAPAAKRVKAVVGNHGRVFVVGRVLDLGLADEIVASGAADMVAMTRAHVADPFLVEKTRNGQAQEVVRCVGANVCVRRLGENNHVACLVNPATGREAEWGVGSLRPAAKARRITVVGAGPAGLRAAGIAAERGHKVTVIDRAASPGGRLRLLAPLPGRARWAEAVGNLLRPLERFGVTLQLGAEAAPPTLQDADEVLVATGARFELSGYSAYRPDRQRLPGADRAVGIDTAIERVTADRGALGRSVLILDEGNEEMSAGLAELLATAGVHVEIVTPYLFWGEALARTYDIAMLLPRLKAAGVAITPQHFVEAVGNGSAEIYDIWNPPARRQIQADTVVLALGREPVDALFGEIDGRGPAARRLGDCLAPRSIEAVIYEGEKIGREL